jgi:hypothetical protein
LYTLRAQERAAVLRDHRTFSKVSAMTRRTTQTSVRFSSAFDLPGFDQRQPAGDYRVDFDEEQIEGTSRLAWRRVGTFIHLPAIATQASIRQTVPIKPADLDAALQKDQQKP